MLPVKKQLNNQNKKRQAYAHLSLFKLCKPNYFNNINLCQTSCHQLRTNYSVLTTHYSLPHPHPPNVQIHPGKFLPKAGKAK